MLPSETAAKIHALKAIREISEGYLWLAKAELLIQIHFRMGTQELGLC